MFKSIEYRSKSINSKMSSKTKLSIYEMVIILGCIFSAIVMLLRVFYGTDITDEAYYISDAIAMIHGNIPYAYNNYSYGTGSAFLIIPLVFLYERIIPNNEGVILYTRICYMLFWYVALVVVYRILKKDIKRPHALLSTGLMIPYVVGVGIYNFSYYSIPTVLSYVCGFVIYDAVEHENKYTKTKLIISGLLMGIAILAHLGFGIVVVIFGLLIITRTKGVKNKVLNICYCLIGGIAEILIVIFPIIYQAGFSALMAGIRNKLYPYPSETMTSATTIDKLAILYEACKYILPIAIVVFIVVVLFSGRYICEKEKKLTMENYILLGVSVSVMAMLSIESLAMNGIDSYNWRLGLVGAIGVVALLILGKFRKFPLLLYIGIYPVILAFAMIVAIDSGASATRFTVAVPALVIYFIFMLENESELVRLVTTVSLVACIFLMGIANFKYVYRDDSFAQLVYQVEEGVYKGIYTTEARAYDLPELEKYLNSVVESDEYYAFRDNVPCAYLMMHTGIMCDEATWDKLNYTYNKNSPANLYDYYQRREAFPQKIIYVDFGRDEKLSIEDENYKYNEFVNTYYKKIDDVVLNETFYHVIVYEYQGGFDGNFDYWIDKHMMKVE